MVLGIRSKLRRGASVEVNYIIHVEEIKPWPPSQSLRSVQTVLLQWENGNHQSGSLTSTAHDSRIVFNESFKLPLVFYRDKRSKDKFQKNYLEFSLFVPRKEKVKGQLLGTAVVNLADYGVIENSLTVNVPLNLKKGSDNSTLVIGLELDEKDNSSSANDNDLEIASFTDDDDEGDYDEEGSGGLSTSEATTVSSPPRVEERLHGNAVVDTEQKFYERSVTAVKTKSENPVVLRPSVSSINHRNTSGVNFAQESVVPHDSKETTPIDKGHTTVRNTSGNAVVDTEQKFYERSMTSVKTKSENPMVLRPSVSSINHRNTSGVNFAQESVIPHDLKETTPIDKGHTTVRNTSGSSISYRDINEKRDTAGVNVVQENMIANKEQTDSRNTSGSSVSYRDINEKRDTAGVNVMQENVIANKEQTAFRNTSGSSVSYRDINEKRDTSGVNVMQENVIANKEQTDFQNTRQFVEENRILGVESEIMSAANSSGLSKQLYSATIKDVRIDERYVDTTNDEEILDIHEDGSAHKIVEGMKDLQKKRLTQKLSKGPSRKQVVEIVPPSSRNSQWERVKSAQAQGTLEGNKYISETRSREKALAPDIHDGPKENGKLHSMTEPNAELSESKSEDKTRVEILEEELREAAAIEVGLYSVVAEHASSGNKVHAPARRLSRFYSSAFKSGHRSTLASAARAAISGLVVVSKSCGNDVPRLTFWLSNSIMLRSNISHLVAEASHYNSPLGKTKEIESESSPHMGREEYKPNEESNEMEDVFSFIIALETVESWLFSRIVESLWWQIFTPHMQSAVAKGSDVASNVGSSKSYGRRTSLRNQDLQGDFSIELWKKAFRDACERLCPNRAGGHECGCLSVLVRLVMEELVNRLDVAMFNAILRESAEEMPTDPHSDPITECKVLPIPVGKSSFGAGVALKNAIGNWSRCLTDLFDLELEDESSGDAKSRKPFKVFRLLHALSDLMMLPSGMLADASTRKEVCPMFGPAITRRVLTSFVPDEFSPDPITQDTIDALDNQEVSDDSSLTGYPCAAAPTKYLPPPAALLTCVGEVGKQVLVSSRLPSSLQKSYTSDDELDELDSPFTSIIPATSSLALAKEKGARKVHRYELLRKIWNE